MMLPEYPIFVPTKGRWRTPYTIRALGRLGVAFNVVVESQEEENYESVIADMPGATLLVLPHRDKGLVATRNWIWDHADALGAERFWTFDDNINDFYRLHDHMKYRLRTPTFLRVIEQFVERYENVPIAGMCYEMFVKRKFKLPMFYLNTRVYSNMLIKTRFKSRSGKLFRNEGFYNDDTDLCLRALKDGWCTMQFAAFLADKHATMRINGGMTPHYEGDGRWKMAEELRRKHPDVTKVVRKWGRWQHHVDYRSFRGNRLVRKPGVEIPPGVDDYGMKLVHLKEAAA